MHTAKGTVYRDTETGRGYVGRHPTGSMQVVAKRGAVLTDEQVAALGLDDLDDHTDYGAIMAKAVEDGAYVTVRTADGVVASVPAWEVN